MTRIRLLPRYSGCSRKKHVVILPPASLFAASSEGSRTSQVAKLLRQKYFPGMFAFFNRSSKVSFFIPASLLVLMSVTTKDRVLGSTASTSSGIGRISPSLKYCSYFSTCLLRSHKGIFYSHNVKTKRLLFPLVFGPVVSCLQKKTNQKLLLALGRVVFRICPAVNEYCPAENGYCLAPP